MRSLPLALLALLGCSPVDPAAAPDFGADLLFQPGCDRDVDCKGSRICVNRACVDPPADGGDTLRPPDLLAPPDLTPLGCRLDGDCVPDGGAGGAHPACCNGVCVDFNGDGKNCGACSHECGVGSTCCAGACTSTATDPANCGGCAMACSPDNITPGCGVSVCNGVCADGFSDCNNNKRVDGCEVATAADPMNCGACGHACAIAHATAGCGGGLCNIAVCDGVKGFSPRYADCDAVVANGCEIDIENDLNNCGGCGIVCSGGHANWACTNGGCAITGCTGSWKDCDQIEGNGCEANTAADPMNCIGCGNTCALAHAVSGCANGCFIQSCTAGFGNCDNVTANGCEANLAIDRANCGTCGKVCANGQICSNGGCQ